VAIPIPARLKRLLTSDYEGSVFRRTFLLLALVLPAFLANFLVVYISAEWLDAADFGIFYAANTIGNILFSGSLVLNLAFTRYLSTLASRDGGRLVAGAFKIQTAVVLWGGLLSALLIVAGVLVGNRLGVKSAVVVGLVVLDAFTAYVGDVGRVVLQVARRTVYLGAYTLVWMVLRLLFCMIGLLTVGTVWGALSGIVFSSLLMIGAMNLVLLRYRSVDASPVDRLPALASELPAISAYTLLVTVSNLDILIGYFVLPGVAFGHYSASAVLPKAILTVVTPLQQMLFPHMVGSNTDKLRFRLRAAVGIVGIAAAGAIAAAVIEPIACGARPGIMLCQPALMNIILLSVVPLVLVRVILLDDIVGHRPNHAFLLILPLGGYAVWAGRAAHGQETTLAWGYLVCALVAAGALVLAGQVSRLRSRAS
jgi:O-antigen/teichoic acid export membrane protein